MPQTSFALLTNVGRAKEAAALANASTITITHIAIGDGATVPSGGETALYNEVARKTISGHGTVVGADNVAYFDCYLAAADGPYTIREAGLIDSDGDLIAIAHYDPPINKPTPSSGQTVEGTVRLEVAFSNIATVVIIVDPSMQVALQRLTRLPWIPIKEIHRNAPPASPVVGDVYVIGPTPTGSWATNAGKVTEYTIAGWAMIAPPEGHGVSLPDGRIYERINGAYVEKIALDAQSGKWTYAADTGAANALVVTLSPAPSAYVAGMGLRVKVAATNTMESTINVNGLGTKAIRRVNGGPIIAGDLVAGGISDLTYDGAAFQLTSRPFDLKTRLTGNLTVWVRPDGNDANDGSANTAAKAFLTIQAAHDYVVRNFELSGYYVFIKMGMGGTYAGLVSTTNITGIIRIVGDDTVGGADRSAFIIGPSPAVAGTARSCIQTSAAPIQTKGCVLDISAASGPARTVWASTGGNIMCLDTTFRCGVDNTSAVHMYADTGGAVGYGGAITFLGANAFITTILSCISAVTGGYFTGASPVLPAVVTNTNVSTTGGWLQAIASNTTVSNTTLAGGASGPRYYAALNGTINSSGLTLPGSSAGVVTSGGQYA